MRARLLAVVVATLAALVLPIAPAGAAVATAPPRIAGVAAVGQTVTAEPGTWDTQGLTLVHTWLLDGVAVADGPEYTPGPADQGHGLSVRETALQDDAPVGEATSDPVAVLGPAPENLTSPSVSGGYEVGGVLQATSGTWSADGFAYTFQWLRDGEPIDGATSSSYTVTAPDWCRELSVVVTAHADGYADGVAASAPEAHCLISDPAATMVSARLVDPVIRSDQHPVVRVRVRAGVDAALTGTVEVRVRGGRGRTEAVRRSDAGRLTIRLPKQHAGRHEVVVRFDPDGFFFDSQMVTRLRVRPGHPGH